MPPAIATATAERLPRFVRRPRLIPNFEITERDEEILKILHRYKYATSSQILSLIQVIFPGSSQQQLLRRLLFLFHGGYIARPRAQLEAYKAGSGSQKLTYALGNLGSDYLSAKFGFRRVGVDFTARARTAVRPELEHFLEITETMLAAEAACRRTGQLQLMFLDEILATLAPPETRAARRPTQWPVVARWKASDFVLHPEPDFIFGIRDLDRPEGQNRKFFFLEADRGTMPTARRDLSKTSMLRKLVGYGHTYARDIHAKRFGIGNVRILIVTPGRQRIANIIAAYREHAASLVSPKFFLFADRAGLSRAEDFLDYPWLDAAGEQHRLLD